MFAEWGLVIFFVAFVVSRVCASAILNVCGRFMNDFELLQCFSSMIFAVLKNAQFLLKMKKIAIFCKKRQECFVCNEKVHTLAGQQ